MPRRIPEVTWLMTARAQEAAAAYQQALDWLGRLPYEAALKRITQKIAEKKAVIAAYEAQNK